MKKMEFLSYCFQKKAWVEKKKGNMDRIKSIQGTQAPHFKGISKDLEYEQRHT
mgnify:CR=1 FL=1